MPNKEDDDYFKPEEIPKPVRERLQNEELGKPYTDVQDGAKIGENGSTAEYVINNDTGQREHLSFGSILTICDLRNQKWYGAKVTSLKQHWPYETDKEGELMDYKRGPLFEHYKEHGGNIYSGKVVAELELLSSFEFTGTFNDDEELQRKPVSTVPGPASVVLLPQDNPDYEPSLSNVLDIPEQGLKLGAYSSDQEYYRDDNDEPLLYNLDLQNMENKHAFVAGTTGTGKTVFLKNYIKQALLDDHSVYAFDIQGDIVQMILPWEVYTDVEEEPTKPKEENKDIQEKIDSIEDIYDEGKKVKILCPVIDDEFLGDKEQDLKDIVRHLKDEGYNAKFEKFSMQFSDVNSSEELEMFLPYLSDQAPDLLTRLFRKYPAGKRKNTLKDFLSWSREIKQGSKSGNYYYPDELEGFDVHKSTYGNLLRNLESLKDKGIFDISSSPDWKAGDDELNIIYMFHLPDSIRHKFEYHIVNQLYKNKEDHEAEGVYTVIDEAHKVIPRNSYTYDDSFLNTVAREFMKIGREGRKYDLNLLISTQKPQDIHNVVYDMTSTEVAFRLSQEDARDMGVSREYQEIIPSYETGCAIVRSPENCKVEWVEVKTVLPKIPHEDPQEFFDGIQNYKDYFQETEEADPSQRP